MVRHSASTANNITVFFFTTKPSTSLCCSSFPRQNTGTKVETRVGLVDVAPSILRAAHLPVPGAMQGQILLPSRTPASPSGQQSDSNLQRAVYSESGYGHLSFGWSVLKAWRVGNYLYVDAPERELYDQSADPLATHNLAPDSKAGV